METSKRTGLPLGRLSENELSYFARIANYEKLLISFLRARETREALRKVEIRILNKIWLNES